MTLYFTFMPSIQQITPTLASIKCTHTAHIASSHPIRARFDWISLFFFEILLCCSAVKCIHVQLFPRRVHDAPRNGKMPMLHATNTTMHFANYKMSPANMFSILPQLANQYIKVKHIYRLKRLKPLLRC